MESSRRAGRPPRDPRSYSMRHVKAQARLRSSQGIYVLFFGFLECFFAVEADFSFITLPARKSDGVGAVGTHLRDSNVVSSIILANPASDPAAPGFPKVSDGFGGSSEHSDVFGSQNADISTRNAEILNQNEHADDEGGRKSHVDDPGVGKPVVNEGNMELQDPTSIPCYWDVPRVNNTIGPRKIGDPVSILVSVLLARCSLLYLQFRHV